MAAINAREMSHELAEELLAPDFYMENLSTAVTDKTYHGAAGVREWISDTFEVVGEGAHYETERSSLTARTSLWQGSASSVMALVRACRSRSGGSPSSGFSKERSLGR